LVNRRQGDEDDARD